MLIEFDMLAGIMTLLTPQQRVLRAFWGDTRFDEDPVCFVRVLDACRIDSESVQAMATERWGQGQGLVWRLSPFSANRMLERVDKHSGLPVGTILREWKCKFNGGLDFKSLGIALNVPTPHGLLLAANTWTSYSIPYPLASSETCWPWIAFTARARWSNGG